MINNKTIINYLLYLEEIEYKEQNNNMNSENELKLFLKNKTINYLISVTIDLYEDIN